VDVTGERELHSPTHPTPMRFANYSLLSVVFPGSYCCSMSGFLQRTFGISSTSMVCCPLCRFSYDREVNWRTTGQCGHTICSDCHMKHNVHDASYDGRWQPCPFGGCLSDTSFEIEQSPNTQLLELAGRLATHYVNSDRYKELEKDVRDSKNMYLEAVKDIKQELQEKDKDLKDREEEIELLRANITALAQFQKRCEDGTFLWDPGSSDDEDEGKGSKDAPKPKPWQKQPAKLQLRPHPRKVRPPKSLKMPCKEDFACHGYLWINVSWKKQAIPLARKNFDQI
jgi:hypothetical protein